MNILFATLRLDEFSGTILYLRDLAYALLQRGHSLVVYSPRIGGGAAEQLRQLTIPVVNSMSNLSFTPEVIHAQHFHETAAALVRYPGVPAVYVCHDWSSVHDAPPNLKRIRRYVAVDETCRDRLRELGVADGRAAVVFNAVNLERFRKRPNPLPRQPARALVFSNNATESGYLEIVRAACRETGLTLDVVGAGVGNPQARPERILADYDLVFAKAKAAMEAMAVGAAVILCDSYGTGPLVTPENVEGLRRLNFGRRTIQGPFLKDALVEQIRRYSSSNAEAVCDWIRTHADLAQMVDAMLQVYHSAAGEWSDDLAEDCVAEEQAWLADYCERNAHIIEFEQLCQGQQAEIETLRSRLHAYDHSALITLRERIRHWPGGRMILGFMARRNECRSAHFG